MIADTAAPGRLLRTAAAERWTGALVVTGRPGGTLYLTDGFVTYAESPAAPGVGELLTASGRLAARTWQAALDLGTAQGRVGQLLLDQGHLTRGELELCVHGATYDAAYFALGPVANGADFVAGQAHWLGAVLWIDAGAVDHESQRRQRLLDEIFPHPQLDSAPVTLAARLPVERVWLTATQWELIVHADGQRTPADLAQLLGRAGYATVQELRRLGALGLLEVPQPPERPAGRPEFVRLPPVRGAAVNASRPIAAAGADHPSLPARADHPSAAALADHPSAPALADHPSTAVPDGHLTGVVPDNQPAGPVADDHPTVTIPAAAVRGMRPPGDGARLPPPELARREPGARLPAELGGPAVLEPTGADEVLLKRIRSALRALR
ncbi:hypothetical protein EV385_4525 [Krasilnikovia cinnamomea]|uniref:PatA-like N-terminal domain-containing protein n=1 Tax=Krasilnikovia cinnamomea TaxID=349313 RepID=A0A4Q7ZNN3_9ACTN|nr:DUF4388 domain-containing protein [Krasilnikovia cinnamomea]RZU52650.1 hypothetical protein EV385_4525 [Krasilnikovia cinnamomea]